MAEVNLSSSMQPKYNIIKKKQKKTFGSTFCFLQGVTSDGQVAVDDEELGQAQAGRG